MAKKSDFAQKLLDDLRLRKQNIASAQKQTRPPDANKYCQQTYRGCRDKMIHGTNGRRKTPQLRHQVSLAMEEASKEIVPVQSFQGSRHVSDVDVPMALAFAIANSRQVGNFGFSSDHSDRRQLFDIGQIFSSFIISDTGQGASRGQFPAFSHLHIRDTSKGAQKLNQILMACSKGLNFDRYSIDVGRELLKGAVDLEESLRMLFNLQEVSEYNVRPQRKKIQLLEGKKEGSPSDDVKEDVIDKPWSYFGEPSRKALEPNFLKQKLPNPTNSGTHKHKTNKHNHQIVPDLIYQRQWANNDWVSQPAPTFSRTKQRNFGFEKMCGPSNSITAVMNGNMTKQQITFSSEKKMVRIPNVIAKLMGLDELPTKTESNKNLVLKSSRPKGETEVNQNPKHKLQATSSRDDSMRINKNKAVDMDWPKKMLHTKKPTVTQDSTLGKMSNRERQMQNEMKHVKTMIPLQKADLQNPVLKVPPRTNISRTDPIKAPEDDQNIEGSRPNTYPMELKRTRRNQMEKTTLKSDHKIDLHGKGSSRNDSSEIVDSKTGKKEREQLQNEQRTFNDGILEMGEPRETVAKYQSPHSSILQKSESHIAKHEAEGDQNVKSKRVVGPKKSEMTLNSIKPVHHMKTQKKLLQKNNNIASNMGSSKETTHAMQPTESQSYYFVDTSTEKSSNGSLEEQRARDMKVNAEKAADTIPPVVPIRMPMRNPSTLHDTGNKQLEEQRNGKARKTEKGMNRKVRALHATDQPQKEVSTVLQELKRRRHERISKANEATPKIPLALEHVQKQPDPSSPSCDHIGDDFGMSKEIAQTTAINDSHDTIRDVSAVCQFPHQDQRLKSTELKEIQLEGQGDNDTSGGSNFLQQQQQMISKCQRQGSLTEEENNLKHILITSQHFLNTAEALFKLHIPISILHASFHKTEENDNRLVIDCGYEVMKRKGRKQELASHPFSNMPIVSMKVNCLNDLVKELQKDLDHLKVREGDVEPYLQNMIEKDIQNSNPDINSMWDFGWNYTMFGHLEKDEIVRDVEKYLLNRLVDEIVRDLYK